MAWSVNIRPGECEIQTILRQRHCYADLKSTDAQIVPVRADGRIYIQSLVLRPASMGEDLLVWSLDDQSDMAYYPTSGPIVPKCWYGQGLFVGHPGRPVTLSIDRPVGDSYWTVAVGYYEAW